MGMPGFFPMCQFNTIDFEQKMVLYPPIRLGRAWREKLVLIQKDFLEEHWNNQKTPNRIKNKYNFKRFRREPALI